MKKIVAWLLSCLLLCCLLLCMGGFTALAAASDSLEDSPEYGEIQKTFSEISQIEENCKESFGKSENNVEKYQRLSFAPELAYTVYECSLPADEIQESGGFSQLEEYGWEVPVRNGNGEIVVVASVKKLDGKWELVSYRQAQEEEIQAISGDGVEKQLERERFLQKAEVSARKTVFLDRYAITVACWETSAGDYIVPLNTSAMAPNITPSTVYAADEFMELLHADGKNIRSNENAGSLESKEARLWNTETVVFCAVLAGLFFALAFAAFWRIKKRKIG